MPKINGVRMCCLYTLQSLPQNNESTRGKIKPCQSRGSLRNKQNGVYSAKYLSRNILVINLRRRKKNNSGMNKVRS